MITLLILLELETDQSIKTKAQTSCHEIFY